MDQRALPADVLAYAIPGGWTVLAGRTDAANERLSLKIARARDRWFHIRGMPGSHVVLRAREDAEPDRATLELAASIAAYHSKARNAGIVPVSCTEARYVSKPRGAKPGTVSIAKESVLKVRPVAADVLAAWKRAADEAGDADDAAE
ncbi:MAG: DUF814 domain-containing protein [Gemmatimonadetes bacterium]|nr:DUF814 domain-containing protein [Gemmatimonadota bacterium]